MRIDTRPFALTHQEKHAALREEALEEFPAVPVQAGGSYKCYASTSNPNDGTEYWTDFEQYD